MNNSSVYIGKRVSYASHNHKQRRHHHRFMISFRDILVILGALFIIITCGLFVRNIAKYPEQFSTIAQNNLRVDLNEGDIDAIQRYKTLYIARDRYLFDGPLSIELMCDKYDLNYETVTAQFSMYDGSLQEFFNKELKEVK